MKAIYRSQGGDKLYKIKGNQMIEVNLESYDYGVIGIIYANMRLCPLDMPNKYAKAISKAKFDKYYKEALNKIKLAR